MYGEYLYGVCRRMYVREIYEAKVLQILGLP